MGCFLYLVSVDIAIRLVRRGRLFPWSLLGVGLFAGTTVVVVAFSGLNRQVVFGETLHRGAFFFFF